ncbi:MAG: hypothetical protein Q7T19_14660 [Caulobacter sp.]|nr:hypothetical protein [Caulobacter sp.]
MKDDGYTLAEALAAMLILGLAMGGLVEGARLIGRMQAPVVAARNDDQALRRAEAGLAELMRRRAGGDESLTGDGQALRFNCSAETCGLSVDGDDGRPSLTVRRGEVAQSFPLPPAGKISLVYFARDGRFDRWPQPGPAKDMTGVMVVGTSARGELPLVVARSWIEHPKTCEFDMIAKGCRTSAP